MAQSLLVNAKQAEIETVRTTAASEIATIQSDSLAQSTAARFNLISAADSSYATTTQTSLNSIRTAFNTLTDASDSTFASFMYFINMITARRGGSTFFNFD